MIEINSDVSYLGKDIREWADKNKGNVLESDAANEIWGKYYVDDVEFKPSDKVYYFVEYLSLEQSYKKCGSSNMWGHRLIRDLEKSPRENNY